MRRFGFIPMFLAAVTILSAVPVPQEDTPPFEEILQQVYTVPAVTGAEERMAEKIMSLISGDCVRDHLGSVFTTRGRGGHHLAIAAGLDEYGFIVSGIQNDGFLNLDRVTAAPHPLFDFNQFGHPLLVWTSRGPVNGILALPSLHTAARDMRSHPARLLTLENAMIDIGAESGSEARDRGVDVLDTVTPWHDVSTLAGDKRAGYSLGDKTCLALLVAAAREREIPKSLVSFLWIAQTKFMYRRMRPPGSLGAVSVARNFKADSFVILGTIPVTEESPEIQQGKGPVLVIGGEQSSRWGETVEEVSQGIFSALQQSDKYQAPLLSSFAGEGRVAVGLFLPVKFFGTPSELVDFQDVKALFRLVSKLAGRE